MLNSRLPIYRHAAGQQSVWSNVNNVSGDKGRAGLDRRHLQIPAGESLVLCEFDGPGVIDRFWLTLNWPGKSHYPGSMLRNRSVIVECYWDDAESPAVRAPLSDFFCRPLGYDIPFENALFSDPCGRSCLSFVPMPFRRRARIKIRNEYERTITLYHAVGVRKGVDIAPEDGYFHALWRRSAPTAPGEDHEIMPRIGGCGRYLGTHLGILSNPGIPLNWHEAPVRFYLDGDGEHPSMMAPSLDDYTSSSWDFDMTFMHRDSGLLLSKYFSDGSGHHAFYNYHRRDPLYFHKSCRVTIRPGFGAVIGPLLEAMDKDPALSERVALPCGIPELRERLQSGRDDWIHGDRSDDVSSVALFYLDRPEGGHTSEEDLATRCVPGWNWPDEGG